MTSRRMVCLLAVMVVLGGAITARGAEYFVSLRGDDARDGTTAASAFATIQKGVNALAAGDTLTIGPGEYSGCVAREGLGSAEADTTIRAEFAGTVVLRGDIAAPAFSKVAGRRFTYVGAYDAAVLGEPQALLEHDTHKLLGSTPDIAALEFTPGLFHYDAVEKKLFVSPSDLRPATGRSFSVAVKGDSGIFLSKPKRVIIDGLAVTGFYRLGRNTDRSAAVLWGTPCGIALDGPEDCAVLNCVAYMNASGIGLDQGHRTRVENCVAIGNGTRYMEVSAGIMSLGGPNQEASSEILIRNCRAIDGAMGIHHYGRMSGPVVLRENIAWGNRGSNLHLKTGRSEDNAQFGRIEHSVVLTGGSGGITTQHNLIMGDAQHESVGKTDIRSKEHADFDQDREFADPLNLDFRLQSDSRFRGTSVDGTDQGPHAYAANVFYVQPGGDDKADGLSMRSAWRTLERATGKLGAGDTLYIAGGTYATALVLEKVGDGVSVRGRGRDAVVIRGGLRVSGGTGVTVERLTLTGPVVVQESKDVTIHNCVFGGGKGLQATAATGLRLTHNVFAGVPVQLSASTGVHLSGNIFGQQRSAAVVTDSAGAVRCSDYNSYQDAAACWSVGGKTLTLAEVQKDHERYSRIAKAEIRVEKGVPTLSNKGAFAAAGPLLSTLGIHHDREGDVEMVRVVGPVVHSVTDTTANIEWWSSGPTGPCHVSWSRQGGAAEANGTATVEANRFGSFSLTGLKPGGKYQLTIGFEQAVELSASETAAGKKVKEMTVSFTTAGAAGKRTTYYVAPEGKDENSGATREQAWGTLHHAADSVRAGDTVMIAGGTYAESVRVRATGDRDKPITFKAMPGERVVFDGMNRSLNYAFYLTGKSHLRFDGLYFRQFTDTDNFSMPWSDRSPGNACGGIFAMYRSDDVRITRCFSDGRGPGYAPGLVRAHHCADVTVENCAMVWSMSGAVSGKGCPNLQVRNNVFLSSLVFHGDFVNEPGQKLELRGNIFTDNIPPKVKAAFLIFGNVESLVEGNNCYFMRVADEERKPLEFYDAAAYGGEAAAYGLATEPMKDAAIKAITQMSVAEYQRQYNPKSGSLAANPDFAAAKQMAAVDREGKAVFASDALLAKADLDFPDLFATNPEVMSRGIGLRAEVFGDFRFSATDVSTVDVHRTASRGKPRR